MLDLNYEPAVLVEDITQLTEEEWLQQRTRGIGGSDVAAVLGISPWKTRRDRKRRLPDWNG
jgi:predicted phage-related endonuclease